MTKDEMKEGLRAIVNKTARSLTDEDKSFLLFVAGELGVERGGKSGCVKCWHDLAMRCYNNIAENETEPEAENDERKYILRKGVDVIFGSIRVNEATLTDDLARKIIAKGFEKKYFVKCE